MNDKKIKTPEELKKFLEAVREEIRRIREKADRDVWSAYENARKIFKKHGAELAPLAELEERAADPIRELHAETAQMRQELDEAADEARELAEEVHAEAVRDFHEHGSERIQDLADQHNISWMQAVERFGNHLAPRPPGYTAEPRAGTVVSMTEEERQEREEVKRLLEGRDLSGLSTKQLETLDITEIEFLTRPRHDVTGEV